MNKMETTKICVVCGDKAIARNFCALTCESCKAFFRRNASNSNKLKCIYGDDCQINLDTRKRCRKCRLVKCFKVGMRKEWILNEEEKKVRNNIIAENRKKKLQNENNDSSVSPSLSPPLSTHFNDSPNISEVPENSSTNSQISENSIDLSENCLDLSLELSQIVRPLTDYNNNFTETEGRVFSELLEATKFLTVLITRITSEIKHYSEAMQIISNKWDEEIRKFVKTAKSLTAFRNICENDKLSLLKYGSVEVAYMRSIVCYDMDNEYWIINLNDNSSSKLNLDVFKQHSIQNYEACKSTINKLAHIWDMDQIILHLLMAIILFMPTRPQLTYRPQIRLQQQIYIHLLKRYLLLKYRSESESKSRFLKLIEVIFTLHDFHEKEIRQFLMKMPPNFTFFDSPLIQELYDKNSDNQMTNILT